MNLAAFPQRGTVRNHIHPGLRVIGFERSAAIALISCVFYRGAWIFPLTGPRMIDAVFQSVCAKTAKASYGFSIRLSPSRSTGS